MTSHLLSLPSFLAARSISIYLSTPSSEIQTDILIHRAFEMGKRLYVPFCPVEDKKVMKMLRLESVEQFEGLGLNRWGIRDLDPTTVGTLEDGESFSLSLAGDISTEVVGAVDEEGSGGLDLILVPGLAFDRTGSRLGHGRGYYDRYLLSTMDYPTRFGKASPLTGTLLIPKTSRDGELILYSTVALALHEQVIDGEVPIDANWDQKPSHIITPSGLL